MVAMILSRSSHATQLKHAQTRSLFEKIIEWTATNFEDQAKVPQDVRKSGQPIQQSQVEEPGAVYLRQSSESLGSILLYFGSPFKSISLNVGVIVGFVPIT